MRVFALRAAALPVLLGVLIAASCGGSQEPGPRPPILLIVMDALAAGHVSHLGYERETTPRLDALAAEGVTFTNAISPAPYTQAGITSLLTGLLPGHHLVQRTGDYLRPELETLAGFLRGHGYRTHAAVSNLNGSSSLGLERGFDTFRELFAQGEAQERVLPSGESKPLRDMVASRLEKDTAGWQVVLGGQFPPVMEEWLAERRPDAPSFFYLHVLEPHSPYQPPEEFRSRFLDPAYSGPLLDGESKPLVATTNGQLVVGHEDVDAARALYDANIAYGDHVVGQVFDLLREAGTWDETLVIVTSDHGEAFWQHDLWGHNVHLYEEMVRVPLIVKPPADVPTAFGKGTRSGALVSPMDVFPSLCQWLDVAPPPGLDGRPLDDADAGSGDGEEQRRIVLRTNHAKATYGLRTSTHKLIVHENDVPGRTRFVEYFDLANDPQETDPLPAERAVGAEAHMEFLNSARRAFAAMEVKRVGGRELTPEEEVLLEKLGYTE